MNKCFSAEIKMNAEVNAPDTMVRHFRQILLWPLQLMPIQDNAQIQKHWEVLENSGPENPWRELSSCLLYTSRCV